MSVPDIDIPIVCWRWFKGVLMLVLLLSVRVQQYNHVGEIFGMSTAYCLAALTQSNTLVWLAVIIAFHSSKLRCNASDCIGYYTMHRHWGVKWARMTYSTCIHCLLNFFFLIAYIF